MRPERSRFEPIAVVGEGCVLPGALTPEELWEAVAEGRDLLTDAPEGMWRVGDEHILGSPKDGLGRAWAKRGGYVQGFDDVFDGRGFQLDEEQVLGLDPLIKWVLHAGRQALGGLEVKDSARAGLILGNLSYPTGQMAADGLTKAAPPEVHTYLRAVTESGLWTLGPDPGYRGVVC